MLYIVQIETKIEGRLIDVFTHSFVYDTEEKAKEYVKRRIKDLVKLEGFKQLDSYTVERVDFASIKMTKRYIIDGLVKDF